MYFGVSLTILAAEYTVGLKMPGKKLARVLSMFLAAFPTILAAEYTAGLKMTGQNWRAFRPCTLLLFVQFWPHSAQQD